MYVEKNNLSYSLNDTHPSGFCELNQVSIYVQLTTVYSRT